MFLSQVSIYEGDKRDCRKFCTTGIDGAMTIWDFKVKVHMNLVNNIFCIMVFLPSLTLVCFSPQSLEASIQGLRIMWRNLVNEWRDAAASLLPLSLPCPRPSCPFSISLPPSTPCDAASNIHTLSSVCWSTDQTITHSCVCAYTLTHTLHTHYTHWADVWNHC